MDQIHFAFQGVQFVASRHVLDHNCVILPNRVILKICGGNMRNSTTPRFKLVDVPDDLRDTSLDELMDHFDAVQARYDYSF